MVQLSHPYTTTGKTIWTFVSQLMSLLFNMLSRFVVAGYVENNKVTADMAILVCCLNEPKMALYPKTHY